MPGPLPADRSCSAPRPVPAPQAPLHCLLPGPSVPVRPRSRRWWRSDDGAQLCDRSVFRRSPDLLPGSVAIRSLPVQWANVAAAALHCSYSGWNATSADTRSAVQQGHWLLPPTGTLPAGVVPEPPRRAATRASTITTTTASCCARREPRTRYRG